MYRGILLEVCFGTVIKVPYREQHNTTWMFEVVGDGKKIDLELYMGKRIKSTEEGPAFERLSLRRPPELGVEICYNPQTKIWGLKHFYDIALRNCHHVEEDPDQQRAQLWAELPPEDIALTVCGRNIGVSHEGKFHRRPSRSSRRY